MHLKRNSSIKILLILVFVLATNWVFAETRKLSVFVSILPQKYFAERLLQDDGEVTALIGSGMSPHTFELLPQQMGKLSRSDLYLLAGIPFEKSLAQKLHNVCPDVFVVPCDDGIEKRTMLEKHHHNNGEKHDQEIDGDKDPHFWLNPLFAANMARNMAKAIVSLRPDLAEKINSRLDSIQEEMITLDKELLAKLDSFKGKTMLVFHPAFGYFADRYGLHQKSVEIEGKEPAPKQLGELIRLCKTEKVKAIFVQKQFPSNAAETIAKSIGGKVIAIDPLSEDYINNLKNMADSIVNSAK